MPERLQPFVRRDRCPQRGARGAREVAGRLLPKEPEQIARPLEVGALGRIGERDEAAHQPGDDRVHSGLEERDPDSRADEEIDRAEVDVGGADQQDDAEQGEPDEERRHRDRSAVGDRDHEQRRDVVDNRDREQVRAQPLGES